MFVYVGDVWGTEHGRAVSVELVFLTLGPQNSAGEFGRLDLSLLGAVQETVLLRGAEFDRKWSFGGAEAKVAGRLVGVEACPPFSSKMALGILSALSTE